MASEPLRRSNERDELLRNVLRLDGAESKLFERSFIKNPVHDVTQRDARNKIPAVRAEVNAAQYDFLYAQRNQLMHFIEHDIRNKTAAAPTDERDHAIRTTIVAAVLNLQNGPRAVAFEPSAQRRYWHRGLRENITGENLSRATRE